MKKSIVLFGAGPHALVVMDIIEQMGTLRIAGLIDSKREIGSSYGGYKIIGRQENLLELSNKHEISGGIVTIGDNYWRAFVANEIIKQVPDFNFENAIHPSAITGKDIEIGTGNVIMPGAIINRGAKIGNHCIINTNSSLEHYCEMRNFSSLSAGVTTGGFTIIGEYSAIALGVTLFDRIVIGKHVVVGSGALVTKDIPDERLAYGVPAKIVSTRKPGDPYLK